MIDSGSAAADTSVARQSRRNRNTTSTARSAPSIRRCIEPFVVVEDGIDEVERLDDLDMRVLGLQLLELRAHAVGHLDLARAARARDLEADDRLAVQQRRRALLGHGVGDASRPGRGGCAGRRRGRCPCAAISAADCTVPMVRTDCSTPPMSARPPEASCWIWRSCREMSAAVALSASRRSGSSSTRTSRDTPPTRATAPTPRHGEQRSWRPCCRRTRTAPRRPSGSEAMV